MPIQLMKGLHAIADPDDLWRYLDLHRLTALLISESLHFTRLDQLADPYEGLLSSYQMGILREATSRAEHEILATLARPSGNQEAGTSPEPFNTDNFLFERRTRLAVNCWFESRHESMPMWQVYGRNGVVVRTSLRSLTESLAGSRSEVLLGRVNYDRKPDLGAIRTGMWKQPAYQDEREVRLMVAAGSAVESDAIATTGIDLPVELTTLCEEIIVSPFAAVWEFEAIRSLVGKLRPELELRVRHSQLLTYLL